VFVGFPWFSEKVVVQTNSSETFYRAFSRRFFCQYAKDTRPAGTLLRSFAGPESLAQVTDKLSGGFPGRQLHNDGEAGRAKYPRFR
jgi:hypothetical protein